MTNNLKWRVFNFFAKSETQQYWNPIVVLNIVSKFSACCCLEFANCYVWLLGGPQTDANLFPNVDSTWKVSVTFFVFYFLSVIFCYHLLCYLIIIWNRFIIHRWLHITPLKLMPNGFIRCCCGNDEWWYSKTNVWT